MHEKSEWFSATDGIIHPDLLKALFEAQTMPYEGREGVTDRYGFFLDNISRDTVEAVEVDPALERSRIEKWDAMLEDWPAHVKPGSRANNTLRQRARKGIPDAIRSDVWQRLLASDRLVHTNEPGFSTGGHDVEHSMYHHYLRLPLKFSTQGVIARDLGRTFPSFRLMRGENGLLPLFRVLYAYSTFNPKVGYCQALNFIACGLLSYMSEVEAFWALTRVLQIGDYQFCFTEGFPGLHMRAYALSAFLTHEIGPYSALMARLDDELPGLNPGLLLSMSHLMTLFFRDCPFAMCIRIIDRLLVDGERTVFRVLVAMMGREFKGPVLKTEEAVKKHMVKLLVQHRASYAAEVKKAQALNRTAPVDPLASLATVDVQNVTECDCCNLEQVLTEHLAGTGKLPSLASPGLDPATIMKRISTVGRNVSLTDINHLLKEADKHSYITNKRVNAYYTRWKAVPANEEMIKVASEAELAEVKLARAASEIHEAVEVAKKRAKLLLGGQEALEPAYEEFVAQRTAEVAATRSSLMATPREEPESPPVTDDEFDSFE